MDNIIIALALLGLGLYFIMNINNDDKCKYIKNSGTLNTDNNLNYLDTNLNNLVDNNTNDDNNYQNENDYNFFNRDTTKVIND